MKDITRFINEELKPRLYGSLPQILPDLHFTKSKKGDKWISPLHFDGSEGTDSRPDRSQVTEKHPTRVWDNSRQEAKDIITLFMERHGLEVWEAVKRLCAIVGIPEPEQRQLTPEQRERYADFERRRKLLEESIRRQALALYQPRDSRAAEVKDYIYKRGFKDWDLYEKMMVGRGLLGYISEEEATALQREGIVFPSGVGTAFTLSIPVYSGSTLCGIKFRNPKAPKGMQRYTSYSLYGGGKDLYNLTGIRQTDGAIVVVESELDALIAEYNGLRGFVATGGGELTEELLASARGRGIKRITLLLDTDERGADFVRRSIDIAHKRGVSILVATIPEGESLPDGTPIHDIGEYLQAHTKDDLRSLIDNATSGSMWLLEDIVNTFTRDHGAVTAANEIDIRNKAIALANHTPNEVERDIVLTAYANSFCIDGKQAFSAEALRAVADRERADENKAKQKTETEKALREALALAEKGDPQAALQMVEEAAKDLHRIDSRAKYSHLLALPTEESLLARLRSKQGELPTRYELTNGRDTENFSLPSGAVTFICAPTSHGKSTLLQNLALQVAESKGDGIVLYFTFEEDGDAVAIQVLNKYIDTELCRNYSSSQSNNLRALRHFFKTGEDRYIADAAKSLFYQREKAFFKELYTSGKLRLYYEDYYSEELIEAIRTISSQTKVKAVFIDYIQLLSSRAYKTLQRREELKYISLDLKNLSIELDIPIVAAAQLNRETHSPLDFSNDKLADSADLERAANKILQIWNTSFTAKRIKEDKKDLGDLEERQGFVLGEGGKIYAKLTKNRGGVVGLEATFTYNGNTGVLQGNCKPEAAEQGSLSERNESNVLPF